MDSRAFKKAVDAIVKEKGIDENLIYEAMELALTSAYKKNYHSLSNVRPDINRETGEIHIYSFKTVVPDDYEELTEEVITKDEEGNEIVIEKPCVYDERINIKFGEAMKIVKNIKVGETIEEEVTPDDFGRVATATAKQVIVQKMREAERNNIMEAFSEAEGELATGIVAMEDSRNYYIDLGKAQGILPKSEIIPGETVKMGSSIKVYISKVDNQSKGPLILLTRSHFGFVKRLFELEVPEINEGIVLVYSVARDPGNRSKVAVASENASVDAVGACIGDHGMRINNIIRELNGEKVDIVPYDKDPAKFIENALSPAKNLTVFVTDDKKHEAMVIVSDDNLSLAIGKKGSNVKLASKLTHYKIDVKTREQAREMGINILGAE